MNPNFLQIKTSLRAVREERNRIYYCIGAVARESVLPRNFFSRLIDKSSRYQLVVIFRVR